MSNEELFKDLKQFISATVSQQIAIVVSNMATKGDLNNLRLELKEEISTLRQEMGAGFSVVNERIDTLDEKVDLIQGAIAEAFTTTNKLVTATLQNHAGRLRRLEHQVV